MSYHPFKNEETRTTVLSGVKGGSEAAWSRFFDIYAGYVFSLANQAGLVGADGDEIVQAVFIELAKPGGFDGYDRRKGAFRFWLRRRVEWRIKDEFRRRVAVARNDGLLRGDMAKVANDPSLEQDEFWRSTVREEAMRRLRAEASPTHFAIFQASVVEEIPTENVMSLYHVSRDNLYQIKKRMRAAFKRHFAEASRDLDDPELPQ
jgi:RNA polymerase sigma factor (sigma-70 family)